jgi:hypothetical protein
MLQEIRRYLQLEMLPVGRAAIWGGSKLTKLVADNWSGIKKFAKAPIKNTAKAIGKGISKGKRLVQLKSNLIDCLEGRANL